MENANVIWESLPLGAGAEAYGEAIASIGKLLNGKKTPKKENPNVGNRLVVKWSAGSWHGIIGGIKLYPNFEEVLDDCFARLWIERIWDDEGTLHLTGREDDSHVEFEIRQLSKKGEGLIDEVESDFRRFPYSTRKNGVEANGKVYVGKTEGELVQDIWNDSELSCAPCYWERKGKNRK